MTSLQLVEYINYLRKQENPLDYTELLHKSFMEKVPKVLKDTAINFASSSYKGNGSAMLERKIAIFEKREAMLMAMSYSYDIQAVVYDAWEKAEKALLQLKRNPITITKARKILSNFRPTGEGI
jgi:hypothetical protein